MTQVPQPRAATPPGLAAPATGHQDNREAAAEGLGALRSTLIILGSAIGMCGGFAVLFVGPFGLFVKPLSGELHWTRSQASLLITAGFLGYTFGAPLLGLLYDRMRARGVLLAALAIFALSLSALGWAPSRLPVLTALAFLAGLSGAATAPSGYVLLLTKTFEHRLGAVIGLAMLGLGAGVSVGPVLTQMLLSALGWRLAYVALGAVALMLGLAALALGVGRGVGGRVVGSSRAGAIGLASSPQEGESLGSALRSWRFWLLAITSLLVGGSGFGATAHLAAILSDRGLDASTAAGAVGLAGAGVFVGRVGAAVLMDRIFAPLVALACALLGAAGLFILSHVSAAQPASLFTGALLMGLLVGSEGDTMPFLTRRYFGARAFGSIYGCVIGLAAVGGIVGPLTFGAAFDKANTYSAVLKAAATICGLCGLAIVMLGPYRYRQADPPASPPRARTLRSGAGS